MHGPLNVKVTSVVCCKVLVFEAVVAKMWKAQWNYF